jgi:hypothetical protein
VGFKRSGCSVSAVPFTTAVARALILLLVSLHASPCVSHAAGRPDQNPDAAVEDAPAEGKTHLTDRPAIMKNAGSTTHKTLTSIARPDWVDGLKSMQLALVHPSQISTIPAASGQTKQASAQTDSGAQKKSSKLKWILIAAAGGAAVGVFAMKGKGGSESNFGVGSQAPNSTITAGPPTVGPPQ